MSDEVQIDLGKLTEGKSVLLSGHERGVHAREYYALDDLDSNGSVGAFTAPENLDAITTSFVQGLMGDSMVHFGTKEALLEHYNLERLPPNLQRDFVIGISRLTFKR